MPKTWVIPLSRTDAGVLIRRVEDQLDMSLTLQGIMPALLNVKPLVGLSGTVRHRGVYALQSSAALKTQPCEP